MARSCQSNEPLIRPRYHASGCRANCSKASASRPWTSAGALAGHRHARPSPATSSSPATASAAARDFRDLHHLRPRRRGDLPHRRLDGSGTWSPGRQGRRRPGALHIVDQTPEVDGHPVRLSSPLASTPVPHRRACSTTRPDDGRGPDDDARERLRRDVSRPAVGVDVHAGTFTELTHLRLRTPAKHLKGMPAMQVRSMPDLRPVHRLSLVGDARASRRGRRDVPVGPAPLRRSPAAVARRHRPRRRPRRRPRPAAAQAGPGRSRHRRQLRRARRARPSPTPGPSVITGERRRESRHAVAGFPPGGS